MSLLRSVSVNLRRSVFSGYFACCVLAVFIICFTNVVGYDAVTQDSLTIPAALQRPAQIAADARYCSFQVFTAGSPMWFTMFAPVLAAFAYVPLFCDERRAQTGRVMIVRQSKLRYALSHVISAMLTGGLTLLCGYLLFGIAVYLLFPSLQSYEPTQISAYLQNTVSAPAWYTELLRAHNFAPLLLLHCLKMFVYGALFALPALLCAAITQNKYVVLCLPFFAAYAWNQLNYRLSAKAIMDFEHFNEKWLSFLNISMPDAVLSLIYYQSKEVLLLHGGFALLLAVLFCTFLQRRLDCGA